MSPRSEAKRQFRNDVEAVRSSAPIRAVVEVIVVALCVGFSLMPMLPSYGTDVALYAIIAGVLCGALTVLVGAFARWALPVTLLVGFGVYVIVGGAVAFGRELVAGLVPSRHSITSMLVGIVTSWKEALTLEPPLGANDGVLILPFLLAFLGTFLVSIIVVSRKSWLTTVLAFVVPMMTLVAGILWGTQETPLGPYIGIALFLVLLVWSSWRMGVWRPKRWIPLIAFLAVLAVGSCVVAPHLESDNPRFVLRSIVVPPFDPRDQISPLAIYRSYVKDKADTPLVTVEGLPEGALIRLATLDSYDGVVWSVSGDQSRAGSGAFRRIGDRINQSNTGTKYDVTFTIEDLDGVWTPTIGYLSTINFDSSGGTDFRFNDATGAGVTIGGVSPGTSYQVTGVIPTTPSDEQLGDSGIGQIALADVSNSPEIISSKAVSIASEASTVPLVVRKFEQYLNTHGFFSHGEAAGGFPSLSGHGAARMADLFSAEIMVGDAEQYASAMALLARSQGIPSRVVVGFQPVDNASSATFTGKDLTAWVEVFYDDFGWVSYFPTPPESQTPQQSEIKSEPEPEPDAIQLPPDPKAPVTPPKTTSEETDIEADQDERGVEIDWAHVVKVTLVAGIPLALLIGVPLSIILAKLSRRKRRKNAESALSVVGGWQELVDHATDLGMAGERDFTRREMARFVGESVRGANLRQLADSADRAHFGWAHWSQADAEAYWREVDAATGSMTRSVPWYRRFAARLSVRSLRKERARAKAEATKPEAPNPGAAKPADPVAK